MSLLAVVALFLASMPMAHDVVVDVNGTLFTLDARDATEEGVLAAGTWSGVGVVNSGEATANVTLSLQRGDEGIEQVPMQLAAGATRVIRIDRLFVAPAHGGEIVFRSSSPLLLFGYAIDQQNRTILTPAGSGTPKRRRAVRHPSAPAPLVPRTIVLAPVKDNTLFESPSGSTSNGAGIHLFAGTTAGRSIRRALLAFDLSSQIPPGSTVTRVSLTMNISQTISGAQPMRLHRVLANWGEGTSNAGSARDGAGTASRSGDATWIHTFFPDSRWITPGGDFESPADALANTVDDSITWSSAEMVTRVQQWLDQPSTNFGWIVTGNEALPATAKRLDSREIVPETTRPALTIEFNSRP